MILPALVSAQKPYYRPQVHEFGLQLASANLVPSLLAEETSTFPLSINPVNGLRYKYHLTPLSGIRAGVFYRTADYAFDNSLGPFENYSANKRDIDVKIGYERKYNLGKAQVFVGVDGIVSQGWISEVGTSFGAIDPNDYSADISYLNYGASVFFGMRYYLHENLSFTIENEFYYTKTTHNISGEFEKFYLFPDNESGFNALSIYLSLHLKKMTKSCTCGKKP